MLELRRQGHPEEALRVALAFLSTDATDHYAWYSAASLCLELGGDKVGISGLASVGEELAENGNLPMALVCLREMEAGGGDSSGLMAHVALLYGRGSSRVKNRVLPPPPLPPKVDEDRVENFRPERHFLVEEADRLMSSALETARLGRTMGEASSSVPYFPMFGSLGMEGFLRLTSAFEVRRFAAGDRLMQQGKTSDELTLLARGEVVVVLEKPGKSRSELAVLGPGALLGEMGMVARTPRSATVEARTAGISLVASIDEIEAIAEDIHEVGDVIVKFCEIRMMENLMTVSPILQPLEPRQRAEVVRVFDHVYLEKGRAAIESGDPPRGIYLVVSGEMAVIREAASKKEADIVYLATLRTGDVFGEISTVMNKPATATVRAANDAALLFLPRERFMEVTRLYPALFQKIYEISTSREEQIASLAKNKAISADDLIED